MAGRHLSAEDLIKWKRFKQQWLEKHAKSN